VLVGLTAPFLFFKDAGDACEKILDLVGGLACGFMAFVLPSWCYWSVYGFTATPGEKRSCMDKVLPPIIFLFGVFGCLFQIVDMVRQLGGFDWECMDNDEMPKLTQKQGT